MRTKGVHLLILAAVACVPLACKDGGCGGGGNGGAPSSSAASTAALSASSPVAAASSSGPRRNGAMMVRAGGPVGALFRGASQLADLKDEQRTSIEKIASDLREQDKATQESEAGAPRRDMKGIQDEILAGVKAGKIDSAKIEPHLANLEKEAKERQARDLDALGKLHAVLEPAQRSLIAKNVKKTDDERAERMKTAETASSAHAGDAGRPSMAHRRFERYGKELDLDADQKKKLEGMIPKDDSKSQSDQRDDMKKRSDATLAAFEKDTFDPKPLAPPDPKRIRQPIDEQVKFFNQLLPILKPEQKDKLAARIEKQGNMGGGGGGFDHGRRRGPGGGDGDHDNDNDDRENRDVH